MSLPEPWIEKIFHKFAVTYGRAWLSMWDGIDIEDVKVEWAEQLAGFQQNPGAIAYALENLHPSKPPTVLEFRANCQRGPAKPVDQSVSRIAYAGPAIDPDELRGRIQAAIQAAKQPRPQRDPRQWARDLAEADKRRPHDLTPAQREMYRRALGIDTTEDAQ